MSPLVTDTDRLLVKIARLYYEENLTQAQMAERLRLSRQKVQRLLQQAREEGVVQINVRPILGTWSELEGELEQRFGLREVVVVDTLDHEDAATVTREVGSAAAEYLLRILSAGDRIVISWGGALLGLVNALAAYRHLDTPNDITVIQGLGGLGDPNDEVHASDLARRLARILRGQSLLLPAPGIAGSRDARAALYHDPYVARTLTSARSANIAFLGIGAPRPDSILVQEGHIVTWPELNRLKGQGAVGDINLRYFDGVGRPLASALDERVVGLTLEEIKGIGHVVGVAGGAIKFEAIRAALAGSLVDVLITDHITARQLLAGSEPIQKNRASKKVFV